MQIFTYSFHYLLQGTNMVGRYSKKNALDAETS